MLVQFFVWLDAKLVWAEICSNFDNTFGVFLHPRMGPISTWTGTFADFKRWRVVQLKERIWESDPCMRARTFKCRLLHMYILLVRFPTLNWRFHKWGLLWFDPFLVEAAKPFLAPLHRHNLRKYDLFTRFDALYSHQASSLLCELINLGKRVECSLRHLSNHKSLLSPKGDPRAILTSDTHSTERMFECSPDTCSDSKQGGSGVGAKNVKFDFWK